MAGNAGDDLEKLQYQLRNGALIPLWNVADAQKEAIERLAGTYVEKPDVYANTATKPVVNGMNGMNGVNGVNGKHVADNLDVQGD